MLSKTAPPRLWPLAWPLFVELFLGIGIGIVGTALASHISDPAAAAFALVNHLGAMLFVLFRIVAVGAGVVITQSLGGGRRDRSAALARAALGASTWMGVACALVALVAAAPLLRLMNAPPEVLPLAEPFLQMLAPALLLDAWLATMVGVMRAHLRARLALAVILLVQALHLGLSLLLMLGAGPIPALGLPGFAVAVIASRALGVALHGWLWRSKLEIVLQPADLWRVRRNELAAVLHIGLPGAAENIAYRLSFMVSIAVVGAFGAQALATHAYASQASHLGIVFGLATGFAVELLVGHLVGAGRLHVAFRLVRRALARGLLIALAAALLMALAGRPVMALFTQDAAIIELAVTLLWWTVLIEPGRTFNLVVVNALRAAGDARYPVAAGAASMLIVLAGGSWLLGRYFGLGLVGVWIAYAADEWIRGLLMWRRWVSLEWVPLARAARRRASREAT